MYAFEADAPRGLGSYGEALWWVAMIMTTLGSQYWPQTMEGRILCIFLALYAFAVFGYATASLASFFIERDPDDSRSALLPGADSIRALREEVAALRSDIRGRAD